MDKKETQPSDFDKHSREVAYLEAVIDNLPVGLFAKDAADSFRLFCGIKSRRKSPRFLVSKH